MKWRKKKRVSNKISDVTGEHFGLCERFHLASQGSSEIKILSASTHSISKFSYEETSRTKQFCVHALHINSLHFFVVVSYARDD